ncbi:hypothetical protein AQUCO_02000072v1 [Aquilegia coerulea]|uniref:Uncharacterized protein n=1 Tax=Aquilegia coerulea TaxID=218851 RepID=A0A2G5DFQ0_AQUCA|nr:hypothetical protein AQUCO_02000072v1 [Aquilegia coerulea]
MINRKKKENFLSSSNQVFNHVLNVEIAFYLLFTKTSSICNFTSFATLKFQTSNSTLIPFDSTGFINSRVLQI